MSHYGLLKHEKKAIEEELGTQLYWDESRQTTRYINLTKNDVNIRDRQNWSDQHKWLYENLEAFYATFAKRVHASSVKTGMHRIGPLKFFMPNSAIKARAHRGLISIDFEFWHNYKVQNEI